ncbi:caspase family protein [Flammeovirga agarivorans]|uniref:Caspase family protein n=1 Tax=Flammeovirga agarivorans TaxID=2726742 RepID=A0A7X8SK02_9BACT|nr:caspase family protein [Flammeovirga agarivorans]NLR91538.1 caspase family protein [Flammeovirga agarivorans]
MTTKFLILSFFLPFISIAQTEHQELVNSQQYALVIGTNDYQGKPDWQNLENAENDAKSIEEVLKKDYFFKTKLLLSPTREDVEKAILRYNNILSEQDRFLIYIAGHGDYDASSFDDGFLVFKDTKTVKKDPTRNTYLQYKKLSGMLEALKAKHVAIVLDVCFGGSFNENLRDKSRSRGAEMDRNTMKFLNKKMHKTTRVYLTSGALEEVPDNGVNGHSPFCNAILNALYQEDLELFTLSDLHHSTKRTQTESLYGSFGSDDPGSEFIFSKGSKVSLSEMNNSQTSISSDINEEIATRGVKEEKDINLYTIGVIIILLLVFVILKLYLSNRRKVAAVQPQPVETVTEVKEEKIIEQPIVNYDVLSEEEKVKYITQKDFTSFNDQQLEHIKHQLSLYEIYRKNLQHAEIAAAKHGENIPPIVLHRMEDAKKGMREVKNNLLALLS